jgi:hypothetical protein
MIVHYLGNVFISSLTGYIQIRASIEIQALYGVIFSLGFVPVTLMILWTRFYSSKWLPVANDRDLPEVEVTTPRLPGGLSDTGIQ